MTVRQQSGREGYLQIFTEALHPAGGRGIDTDTVWIRTGKMAAAEFILFRGSRWRISKQSGMKTGILLSVEMQLKAPEASK